METGIKGKVALVTGASEGLGRACAEAFAAEGCRLAIVARRPAPLKKLAHQLEQLGAPEVLSLSADVAQLQDLERVFAKMFQHFGSIHILLNNAGSPPEGYFLECSDTMWLEGFEQNYLSIIRAARLALPSMQEGGWGRIINISSVAARQPVERLTISNALRSGLAGLIRTMANEFSAQGITINNILPGFTHTERVARLADRMADLKGLTAPQIYEQWEASIPAGRLASPSEIGGLALFLASDAAGYITGTSTPVDGGLLRANH